MPGAHLYEGMFLIDNEAVRRGWPQAKAQVTDLVLKHGGTVHCARRWDERRLAYSIRGRRRATYLLVHAEIPHSGYAHVERDLNLAEAVLRYLILRVDEVPQSEKDLAALEAAPGFSVPDPLGDDEGAFTTLGPGEVPPTADGEGESGRDGAPGAQGARGERGAADDDAGMVAAGRGREE
jgi:small subunit ribosomal protein S6